MSLLFRLFWIFFTQTRGRRARDPFAVEVVSSCTLPNDLDLNGHVNNGRLMTYIDFGRIDWLYKNGMLGAAYRRGFIPVIGDISVRFLRPLKVFERFQIESRVLAWNDQWGYFEHRIVKADGRVAVLLVNRGKFWSPRQGTLMVSEVLGAVGYGHFKSPLLPEWVQTWVLSLDQLKNELRRSPPLSSAAAATPTIVSMPNA